MGKINYYELAEDFLNKHYRYKSGYSLGCWNGKLWNLVKDDDASQINTPGDDGNYIKMGKAEESNLKILICKFLQTEDTCCPIQNITRITINNVILNIKGLVLEAMPTYLCVRWLSQSHLRTMEESTV